MKYLLLVKGDGRGHLTQALALTALLEQRGHSVVAYGVGLPREAALPQFFLDRVQRPIHRLESPNFVVSARGVRVDVVRTVLRGLRRLPAYVAAADQLHDLYVQYHPDVVINLYEPLATVHKWRHGRTRAHVVHISHQALLLHPNFSFPAVSATGRRAVVAYTRFVDASADSTLALSFYDLPPAAKGRITVVSPLLRPEVFQQAVENGNHVLAYMVYPGLAQELIDFNARHPEVPVEAYWHNPGRPQREQITPTLAFNQVHDTRFLAHLASCRGVVTTAGFETVCEALYFRKPALLMPMPGQYEQAINAQDAAQVGAGLPVDRLNPEPLLGFAANYRPDHAAYTAWLHCGESRLVYALEHPEASDAADPEVYFRPQPVLRKP